jgi:hypothetical protein
MTWEAAMNKAIARSREQRRRWRVYGRSGRGGWHYSAMPADEHAMMTFDDLPATW